MVAQETDDIYEEETVEECGIGCKIWQFLFGSKEARAGKAWWDRGALVGEGIFGPDVKKYSSDWQCTEGNIDVCLCTASSCLLNGPGTSKIDFSAGDLITEVPYDQDPAELPWTEAIAPRIATGKITKPLSHNLYQPEFRTQKWNELEQEAFKVVPNTALEVLREQENECTAGDSDACAAAADFYQAGEVVQQDEQKAAALDKKAEELESGVQPTAEALNNDDWNLDIDEGVYVCKNPKCVHGGKEYKEGDKLPVSSGTTTAPSTAPATPTATQPAPAAKPATPAAKAPAPKPVLLNEEGVEDNLKNVLGANFEIYRKFIGANEFFTGFEGQIVMRRSNPTTGKVEGSLFLSLNEDTGVWTGEVTKVAPKGGGFKEETIFVKNQQVIATKTAPGKIKVGNEDLSVDKDATGKEIFSKEGLFYQVEDEEDGGNIKYDPEDDTRTVTNYIDETQDVYDTKTGEQSKLKGDSYIDGEGGCKEDRCFVPTGGHETRLVGKDKKEKPIYDSYLVDYDYRDLTGADRIESLEAKGYFNPRSGRKEGETFHRQTEKGVELTTVVAQREHDEKGKETGKYTGKMILKDEKTGTEIIVQKQGDHFVQDDRDSSPGLVAVQQQYQIKQQQYQAAQQNHQAALNKLSEAQTFEDKARGDLVDLERSIEARKKSSNSKETTAEEGKQLLLLKAEFNDAPDARNKAENEEAETREDEEALLPGLNDALGQLQQEEQAQDELTADLNEGIVKEKLGDNYSSSQGGLATAQTILESIYAVSSQVKSYPAISNLLFGEAEFYQDWRRAQDAAFAPLLGENWFPSLLCEDSTYRWLDKEAEGKAVIKTVSGTYQAVASIQMERSAEISPILCQKNPDQEAEEQWICDRHQICVDDSFCYADKDDDDEADNDEPLRGHFYKITWAVSAPQDEAYTPLVDENGVAVSFNIWIDQNPDGQLNLESGKAIYNLAGNTASPIQLQNGASDRDAIIKYSPNLYEEACIIWNQPPRTVESIDLGAALTFGVAGEPGDAIGPVCYGAGDPGFTSAVGKVNWENAGQQSTSVSQNKGEISRNTDW